MSKPKLSIMDHSKGDDSNMRYLVRPRGKGWVFRMVTPAPLVGCPNPWDGTALGKEIKRGLGTRHLPTARKRHDVFLADIHRLEAGLGDEDEHGGIEMVLHDRLEAAEARGVPLDKLRRFSRVAAGKGYPLDRALSEYVEARRPGNPFGFKPLKRSTVKNLETAAKHLREFLQDDAGTACLEDVKPDGARRFRDVYLPASSSHRNPNGMTAQTVAKNVNLLRQMWVWALDAGKTRKRYSNPWVFAKGISRVATRAQVREAFQPFEAAKLLRATRRGTHKGDLFRLAIATGCRADEIATLRTDQVRGDGSGFKITEGKTKKALRFVPVVEDARDLLEARMTAHGSTGRVFPEWPVRPSTGKAAAVSQWFTRFRRETLGTDTNNRLTLHSTRHTWRTVARRAGLDEAVVQDLGGWEGRRGTDAVYDHGLHEEQLEAAQRRVWGWLKDHGYLEGF